MKCPHDGTLLQPVSILNVELDKCHECDGIWFDKGELEKARDAGATDLEEAIEKEYGDPAYDQQATEGYMQCPRCDGRLFSHHYTYVAPVKVDTCRKCLGVWLDDGELDKIVGQKKGLDDAAARGKLKDFLLSFLSSGKK
jgi:Zn-finger nucleic acid-binding protein